MNQNRSKCLLERLVDVDDSLTVPFDSIVRTLNFLYKGLSVYVVFEVQVDNPFTPKQYV